MVIVDGPVRFRMGSPPTDKDRQDDEIDHRRLIPRRFAIASREVTIEEFRRFSREVRRSNSDHTNRYSPDPAGPKIGVNWFQAAAYCNWLSEREACRAAMCPCPTIRGARVQLFGFPPEEPAP